MVGSVATMRVSSVMVDPSSVRGTLKSTRMNTCLLAKSISRMVSLDMVSLSIVSGQSSVVGKDGIHLDFDAPGGIQQSGNNHHGGGRTHVREKLPVYAAHGFPIIYVGEKHPRA